jgi:peptide/nickel transport system ATP-binding protein
MIAMAIACQPKLLIADEPTTGLDVTTQKQVMDLLARITADRGMAMMLITHDLALAAQYCQNIVVLERGRIVEEGETGKLFHSPQHPYTRRLVAASPTPRSTVEDLARAAAAAGEVIHARPSAMRLAAPVDTGPLLDVRNLVKKFGVLSPAVDDVSFSIHAGGSLGLVGESGSGKSTISRMVCRLLDKTDGDIFFDGQDIGNVPVRDFHKMPPRRDIQLVFQDPDNSLNPRFTAFDCIAHPLRTLARNRSEATIATQVHEVAARCGLPMDLLGRFPHQLSGGQKARVGIARAIAPRPRLLVLDEPTAALDVSVQAIILNLLLRLRHEDGTAFLFVSHDLNVVRLMCEHVVVLQLGQVVEQGEVNAVFKSPTSEYTRELLAAIPHFDPTRADKVRVSNG